MTMKILLLAAILAAASATHQLLGKEKCTWGPTYWCESAENAQECKTEQHCREKVWIGNHPLAKLTKPKAVDNGNCAVCEMIGAEVLSKLKNNATEEEVIGEMDNLCEYVPKTETCKNFVEKYGRQLWEEFIQNADVKQLCTLMGFCSEEFLKILTDGKVALLYLRGKTKDIGCDTCSAAMSLVQKEVLANEKAIETLLDESCTVLPIDKGECTQILNSIFESAVTYFESYTAAQLCQMMGLCSGSFDTLLGPGPVQIKQMPPMVNNLGENGGCENGPKYWCASDENARKCNMVAYCATQGIPSLF